MNIVDKMATYEDLLSPGISACVGCNVELTLRTALKVLGRNTILAIPPGCMGGVGVVGWGQTMGTRVPVFFPLLDNTASMLAGIKKHYQRLGRKVNVVAFAGDGATVDAGFQALSGAAERGDNIIYICYDNEGYMNTGFQRSGSTTRGSWTSTTPVGERLHGKTQHKKDMAMIMAMHGIPYVATASPAFIHDFVRKVERAMQVEDGLAYIHVQNTCSTGWRFPPEKSISLARLAVETRLFPLYEVDHGKFTISRNVAKPRPLREYLSQMKKYAHLTEPEIDELQQWVNERWERLKALAALSAPAGAGGAAAGAGGEAAGAGAAGGASAGGEA